MRPSPEQLKNVHLCQGTLSYLGKYRWATAPTLAQRFLGGTDSARVNRVHQMLLELQDEALVRRIRKSRRQANRRNDHWILTDSLTRIKARLLAF